MTLLTAEMNGLSYKSGYETAWDGDVINDNLVPELFHVVHAVEIYDFNELGVYENAHRSHQIASGRRVIGVR